MIEEVRRQFRTIPGLKDAIDWTLWSPRIGFAYQIGERSVVRGFYGKFYDGNVTGNWYAPPPDAPTSPSASASPSTPRPRTTATGSTPPRSPRTLRCHPPGAPKGVGARECSPVS